MLQPNLRNWRLIVAAALATIALAAAGAACGDDDDKGSATVSSGGATAAVFQQVPSPDKTAPGGSKVFVGHDKANKTSVGLIVFSDSKAVAYSCDGDATWTWYEGSVSGNEVTLKSADGAKFTAKISGSAVTGTATAGGNPEFTLDAARDHAGLYRASFVNGANTETAGWVIENDSTVRGGIGATVAGKKLTAGALIIPTQLGDVQALPEFADLKILAPNFPTLPPNLTVFTRPGGLCARLANAVTDSGPSTTPANTNSPANRARIGLMGMIGCAQTQFFT